MRMSIPALVVSLLVGSVHAAVNAPVLKWQRGGCATSFCERGWYSSPAIVDLDGDGDVEVVGASHAVFALDGATGATVWKVNAGRDAGNPTGSSVGRTWGGVIVADVDNNGQLDVVTAHAGGWVSVYDRLGFFKPGWPVHPITEEFRGAKVADLDADGTLDVLATGARSNQTNAWIYSSSGALRAGWPQLTGSVSYAWGVYNDNAAVGDLVPGGTPEIVVPSDVHYILQYRPDGSQIDASATYGTKKWGQVGVWEDPSIELQGFGFCDGTRKESHRTNFATGAAVIADVDRNGTNELVVTGNTYDCSTALSRYNGVYIFRSDRTRWSAGAWNWATVPHDTGAPLSEDYAVIESPNPDPVVADLDGDGIQEILYASYDGRVHAFWLDGTEHGSWPFSVYTAGGEFRMASPPVVADLDADGKAEVIFGSWPQQSSTSVGKLHIVGWNGVAVQEVPLPAAFGSTTWNGVLASPTLGNVDADADLEVALLTTNSGVVVYDFPGSANARVLWSTGRGNLRRTGGCLAGPAPAVDASVRGASAANDVVLSWQPQIGAAAYAVWRSTSRNLSGAMRIGTTGATSFTDAGARLSGVSYYYEVRALNACGQ